MKSFKRLAIIIPVGLILLFFVVRVFAAAPDGAGPWADNVLSSSQGMMKNGSAVPAIRSNTSSALGVAENNTTEGNFYSLGFGGNIALGFDNGISSGAMIVEATNPGYPGETANVEMSEDGINWIMAGTLTADGTVNKPENISCARYVRITDTSNTENFSDATADGFDVDGVQASGEQCTPTQSPTPTTIADPTSTPAPTSTPIPGPTSTPGPGPTSTPGPGPTCTPTNITVVPNIIEARRLSSTSIFVNWGTSTGFTNFEVQYGFQDGNWQFTTHVNGTSTTINDLPANQGIWVRVAATDNCSTGSHGGSLLVGGSTPGFPNTGTCSSNPLIPCFPNTGNVIPGLPNTGIDPENNIFSSIQKGIDYILSFFVNTLKI